MTTTKANKRVESLYTEFTKTDYDTESLKDRCRGLSNVEGIYPMLSHKNALKMATMCSSLRFDKPFSMLINLEQNLKETTKL